MAAARLPFGPLEAAAGATALSAARRLGVHPRQIHRWRTVGVTWIQADDLAIRIGLHPSEVWGTAWDMSAAS